MANDLTNSAICDILSLFGIPTNTIQNIWHQHIEKTEKRPENKENAHYSADSKKQ